MNLTIQLTSDQTACVMIALRTEIAESLRLRRHESARQRIRECIALTRRLTVADFNLTRRAAGLRPLTDYAAYRAARLAYRRRAAAQPLALAA